MSTTPESTELRAPGEVGRQWTEHQRAMEKRDAEGFLEQKALKLQALAGLQWEAVHSSHLEMLLEKEWTFPAVNWWDQGTFRLHLKAP